MSLFWTNNLGMGFSSLSDPWFGSDRDKLCKCVFPFQGLSSPCWLVLIMWKWGFWGKSQICLASFSGHWATCILSIAAKLLDFRVILELWRKIWKKEVKMPQAHCTYWASDFLFVCFNKYSLDHWKTLVNFQSPKIVDFDHFPQGFH